MSVVFDTAKLPVAQRAQAARDTLASAAAMAVRFQSDPEAVKIRLEH